MSDDELTKRGDTLMSKRRALCRCRVYACQSFMNSCKRPHHPSSIVSFLSSCVEEVNDWPLAYLLNIDLINSCFSWFVLFGANFASSGRVTVHSLRFDKYSTEGSKINKTPTPWPLWEAILRAFFNEASSMSTCDNCFSWFSHGWFAVVSQWVVWCV